MHALRLLIAAFLVLMNRAVNAELITASFGGTVTLIIDNGSILHPTVQLGSRVSGAFTFESTAQGAPVTDGKTYLAGSNFGPVHFWMSTEVYSFHSPSLQIDVANNALPHQNPFGPREDRYRVGCWSGIQSISGLNVEHMALEFSTTETATLADTSLPLSAWSLAGFDQALIVFCSRNRHALKLLTYDGQGFWLFQKRLSRGRFTWWPDTKETSWEPSGSSSCACSCRRIVPTDTCGPSGPTVPPEHPSGRWQPSTRLRPALR